MTEYLVLVFGDLRVALPIANVERVTRAAYLTPLPNSPAIILGMVNIQGRVIPVINMRRRFKLPERAIALTDQLVIAHTRRRPVALVADAVNGVHAYDPPDIVGATNILPDIEFFEGVVKLDDGLVLIHNLDRFLSLDEAESLDQAMAQAAAAR